MGTAVALTGTSPPTGKRSGTQPSIGSAADGLTPVNATALFAAPCPYPRPEEAYFSWATSHCATPAGRGKRERERGGDERERAISFRRHGTAPMWIGHVCEAPAQGAAEPASGESLFRSSSSRTVLSLSTIALIVQVYRSAAQSLKSVLPACVEALKRKDSPVALVKAHNPFCKAIFCGLFTKVISRTAPCD